MKQRIIILFFISCLVWSCSKDDTKYKSLLNGKEVIYPGPVSNFKAFQGNLRAMLQWNPSPDPSITGYVIYWNNGSDSVVLKTKGNNTSDIVATTINGIGEYVQNFVLYTFDANGNRSIGQSLSGVRIYGPLYVSSLVNRSLNSGKPTVVMGGGSYKLFFSPTDTALNINTRLSYTDSQSQPRIVNVGPKMDSTILMQAASGTKIAVRSSYIPVRNAIDTFNVAYTDTIVLQ